MHHFYQESCQHTQNPETTLFTTANKTNSVTRHASLAYIMLTSFTMTLLINVPEFQYRISASRILYYTPPFYLVSTILQFQHVIWLVALGLDWEKLEHKELWYYTRVVLLVHYFPLILVYAMKMRHWSNKTIPYKK